jgi:hypothetical protein
MLKTKCHTPSRSRQCQNFLSSKSEKNRHAACLVLPDQTPECMSRMSKMKRYKSAHTRNQANKQFCSFAPRWLSASPFSCRSVTSFTCEKSLMRNENYNELPKQLLRRADLRLSAATTAWCYRTTDDGWLQRLTNEVRDASRCKQIHIKYL